MSDAAQPTGDKPTQPDLVATWPHLVRVEMLMTIACMVVLTVWSIVVDAPLEEAANPNRTPDPSKAPWYFLGLQEVLVYFDPWIAGVIIPVLIIVGLMAIPYLDRNPKGNGYFTFRERRFAITTFLFGFVALWIIPIVIGVFCRGPGWNWYWPWESWDIPKVADLPNVNLHDVVGVGAGWGAFAVGFAAVAAWYGLGVAYWFWKRRSPAMVQLGAWRYVTVAFLFLTMMAIPVKMALRHLLNLKYIWTTPWFNI
jgi:hypothetical protein